MPVVIDGLVVNIVEELLHKRDKTMKAALVRPTMNRQVLPFEDTVISPPIGLLYIASILEQNGFSVRFFDQKIDYNISQEILKFNPDILGVGCMTADFNNGIRIAKEVKCHNETVKVVFGGPHVTALPDEIERNPVIDFVLVGEAEFTMMDLCKALENSQSDFADVNNLVYIENGLLTKTASKGFLSSEVLDELPMPAYHLLEVEKYFDPTRTHGLFNYSTKILPIMTSRGCPFCVCFLLSYDGLSVSDKKHKKYNR